MSHADLCPEGKQRPVHIDSKKLLEKLNAVDKLYKDGIIDESEYDRRKENLLIAAGFEFKMTAVEYAGNPVEEFINNKKPRYKVRQDV